MNLNWKQCWLYLYKHCKTNSIATCTTAGNCRTETMQYPIHTSRRPKPHTPMQRQALHWFDTHVVFTCHNNSNITTKRAAQCTSNVVNRRLEQRQNCRSAFPAVVLAHNTAHLAACS